MGHFCWVSYTRQKHKPVLQFNIPNKGTFNAHRTNFANIKSNIFSSWASDCIHFLSLKRIVKSTKDKQTQQYEYHQKQTLTYNAKGHFIGNARPFFVDDDSEEHPKLAVF
jgi:hypothetical protein